MVLLKDQIEIGNAGATPPAPRAKDSAARYSIPDANFAENWLREWSVFQLLEYIPSFQPAFGHDSNDRFLENGVRADSVSVC